MTPTAPYRPALVVVDVQEDFCPPNGALAVNEGRDVAEPINDLLKLPFVLRVATKDWHPQDHISFAANHPAPDNLPFESMFECPNPENPQEIDTIRLWPVHCVQNTPGADLIPELDVSSIEHTVEKGTNKQVETYSAFGSPFKNPTVSKSNLAEVLRDHRVSHVFVVGLAMDYCVRCTAADAAAEGFETVVIRECTRAVDPSQWNKVEQELAESGVRMVNLKSAEVARVSASA